MPLSPRVAPLSEVTLLYLGHRSPWAPSLCPLVRNEPSGSAASERLIPSDVLRAFSQPTERLMSLGSPPRLCPHFPLHAYPQSGCRGGRLGSREWGGLQAHRHRAPSPSDTCDVRMTQCAACRGPTLGCISVSQKVENAPL